MFSFMDDNKFGNIIQEAIRELPDEYTSETPGDLAPLLETIVSEIPNSNINEPNTPLISKSIGEVNNLLFHQQQNQNQLYQEQ